MPEATLVGVVDAVEQQVKINPPNDLVVGPADDLVLLRPTTCSYDTMKVLSEAIEVSDGGRVGRV